MPFLAAIPAWVSIAASLAGTGLGIGETIHAASEGGSKGPGATLSQPNPPKPATTGPTLQQLAGAISPQSANVAEQTSGLANPDYIASIAQILAGTAGQPNSPGAASSVIDKLFGLNGASPANSGTNFQSVGTTGTSTPSGPVSFSDFANQLVQA